MNHSTGKAGAFREPGRGWRLALGLTAAALATVLAAGGSQAARSKGAVRPQGDFGTIDLTNGTGDATATATVDAFGRILDLDFDPVGPIDRADTTFDSKLLLITPDGKGGTSTTYLTAEEHGDPGFNSSTSSQASSTFTVGGFRFDLVQQMLPASSTGSIFRQTYTVTNLTGAPRDLALGRYFDPDLAFDKSIADLGGASPDGQTLFAFESPDTKKNTGVGGAGITAEPTFVGMDMNGQANEGWRIDEYERDKTFAEDAFAAEGLPYLTNQITSGSTNTDTNGDRITDFPYDVILALGRSFTVPGNGSVTLVTNTILGQGEPGKVITAPSNLDATAQNNGILVTWQDNSTGETGFRLERRTEPGGSFGLLTTTGPNTTSFLDQNVTGGVTYTYRVQALFDGAPPSGFSNQDSATALGDKEPPPPSGSQRGRVWGSGITRFFGVDKDAIDLGGEVFMQFNLDVRHKTRRGRLIRVDGKGKNGDFFAATGHVNAVAPGTGFEMRSQRIEGMAIFDTGGPAAAIIFGTARVRGLGRGIPFAVEVLDFQDNPGVPGDRFVGFLEGGSGPLGGSGGFFSFGGNLLFYRHGQPRFANDIKIRRGL
jgi:hypothetical protein